MNARDKAIVADLERFRCLGRDDIVDLYFAHTKNPVTQANLVLKRLRRDKFISCSTDRRKYIYFPSGPSIKKDSAKIGHFLAIAEFYRQVRSVEHPKSFIVEPKYGKGQPEPDAFMIWKGMPWFVEIQRTQYSDRQMTDKLNRYESYFLGEEWKKEAWQLPERKLFPYVWICGKGKYMIGTRAFRVFQTDVDGMMVMIKK